MMPTQFYLGPLTLNTYTLLIALGAILGCAWTLWKARHTWLAFSAALNGLLIVAVGALVLGRLGYVLLNLPYFQEHWNEVISGASPGIWEHVSIIGGLAGWAVATRLGQPLRGNQLILLATLIGAGAAIGCTPHGCAYGREVFWTDGWVWNLRVDWPDAYTINNPRLPTQLFMLVWLAVCAVVVAWDSRRNNGHWRMALWVFAFAIGDFVIQFVRADAMPSFGPLRLPQWVDIVLAVCCGLWVLAAPLRRKLI